MIELFNLESNHMDTYYFSPANLFLKNAYDSEDFPDALKKIDAQEQIVIDQENEFIHNYSKSKITAFKVSMVVLGIGIGAMAAALVAFPFFNSLELKTIDQFTYVGMFIGSIVGYIVGLFKDSPETSERLAIFAGKITQKRIDRMQEKLQKINDLMAKAIDNDLEKLEKAKTYVEKLLAQKGKCSRFYELFNIRKTTSDKG